MFSIFQAHHTSYIVDVNTILFCLYICAVQWACKYAITCASTFVCASTCMCAWMCVCICGYGQLCKIYLPAFPLNGRIPPVDVLAVQARVIELGPEAPVVHPFARGVEDLPLSSDGEHVALLTRNFEFLEAFGDDGPRMDAVVRCQDGDQKEN